MEQFFFPRPLRHYTLRDHSLSTTSATHDLNVGAYFLDRLAAGVVKGATFGGEQIFKRFSLASTTTVYLTGRVFFTVSTMDGNGLLWARRRR